MTTTIEKATAFVLRLRASDDEPWGEPNFFESRRERNRCASFNRIVGGLRTWCYEQQMTDEDLEVALAATATDPDSRRVGT